MYAWYLNFNITSNASFSSLKPSKRYSPWENEHTNKSQIYFVFASYINQYTSKQVLFLNVIFVVFLPITI